MLKHFLTFKHILIFKHPLVLTHHGLRGPLQQNTLKHPLTNNKHSKTQPNPLIRSINLTKISIELMRFWDKGGGHGFSVSILLLFLSSLCYYKLVLNMDPCQPCYSVAVLPWPKNWQSRWCCSVQVDNPSVLRHHVQFLGTSLMSIAGCLWYKGEGTTLRVFQQKLARE